MLVTNPLAQRSWARQTIEAVSRGWWVLLVSGIISIVAGGIIVLIDWSVSDLAVFLGVLLIVRGIFTMSVSRSTAASGDGRSSWDCSKSRSAGRCWSGPTRRCW